MPLPAPLSRRNPDVHKNTFGHTLILAGSRSMLGAAALTGLAAMRCGAGLVTLGVPKSLNATLQKKISPVLMTLPLPETPAQSLASGSLREILSFLGHCHSLAIGPGLSKNPETKKLIQNVIAKCPLPLVIDADALNPFQRTRLANTTQPPILTPHPGEMARLIGRTRAWVEAHRQHAAHDFAIKNNVILVLKGHRTIVADANGKLYVNKTGNSGMATAGSGDVLTGILAALLGQGIPAFTAACWGVYLHGLAGDYAARKKTKAGMIATDIIDCIPRAIKSCLSSPRKLSMKKNKNSLVLA